MTVLFLIAAIFVILAFALLAWYALDALFEKEDFVTSKVTAKKIAELIVQERFGSSTPLLIDLGSSHGKFLLQIIALCPGLRGLGVDKSVLRTWIAKARGFTQNRARFLRGDVLKADVASADIIYVYLPRPFLAPVAEKLKKEMKPQAIAITSRVRFPDWDPLEIIPKDPLSRAEEDIFVYSPPVNSF